MLRFPLIAAAFIAVGATAQAEGDAALGEKVFRKCAACHSADPEARKPGPHLQAISVRPAAAVEGFRYSSAMKDSGLVWDDETLRAFLADPKGTVPRTKMAFPGLRKDEDLDNIIAYLKGL
ncbi:cytochrome c family protein [Cognatishimia sp.]|uniref:c-type cytochrome n=1 Tax=Cognatishimia sp. TaxID=2211648 RepID=UPI003515447E|nr:cytochrome c family protein [Cognatishimia sp.]